MIDPLAKKGMRIRMQMMDDERPISSGMEGVINHIDSLGTLHVKWDNGRTMGVVPEIDKYELLPPEEDQIGLDVFEDSAEKLMKKISKSPISSSIDKTFKKAYTKNNLKAESKNDFEIDYDKVLELMKDKGWGDSVSNRIENFESSDYYSPRRIYSTNEDPTMNYVETFHIYMNDLSTGVNESINEALTLFHFTVPKDQHGINKMVIKAKNREEAEKIISKKYGEGEWEYKGKGRMFQGWDEIKGGVADGMTIKDIAKKHNVPIGDIKKELKIGTKIELEHTDSRKKAKEITMDHLAEFPDYYSNEEHGLVASEKKLEKDKDVDLEETTTAGAAGAYNAPLFGKPTTIKKPKTKKTSSKIITKGDLKNPLGKIYSFKPKTESKVFKVGDLLSEISSTHASKLRAAEGTYDGDPWVGKKGWLRKDELTWEGGKIADILAKLDINWNDTNLSLTDKETDAINEDKFTTEPEHFTSTLDESKKKKESPIHKKKWERCVKDVEKKNKENKTDYNPYSVCTASIGYEGSIKKPHRRKDKEDIEETTTFSSVFGSGYPVTPFMFAKKGKHIPSKKPIWKGGKIVQKTTKADLLDEINKVKWVKGGKYVKIKDRCAKYNNKPWCSQGAIDNPLQLSDTVFENIEKISKKTGVSEEKIYDKIKAKLNGVSKEQMEYNRKHNLPIWWNGTKEGFYEKMEPRNNNIGSN